MKKKERRKWKKMEETQKKEKKITFHCSFKEERR